MLSKSYILSRNLHPSNLGRTIHTVAIIGGGIMGSGIAQVAAASGNKVYIYDHQRKELDGTRDRIERGLDRIGTDMFGGDAGRMAEYVRTTKSNLNYTADPNIAFGNTDLILEAIHENEEAKTRLLTKLEAQTADPKTIFASNTVSISIANIASHSHRKDKFIGCRFFFPVPQTIMAEITRTVETSNETIDEVTDWVKRLGKIPLSLVDAPGGGGIIHRLPIFKKAFATLSRGGVSLEEIDMAMKHSLGLYMGPFRIMDEIGLDVFLTALQALEKKYPDDPLYTIPPLLQKMVDDNKLGVKSGQGFYPYRG